MTTFVLIVVLMAPFLFVWALVTILIAVIARTNRVQK
jgi:hypothetical protein